MSEICKFEDAVKSTITREGGEDFISVTYLDYVYGIFVIADDCVQDVFVYDSDIDTVAFVAEFNYSAHYEVHQLICELKNHRLPFNSEHFLKSEFELPF